MTGVKETGTSTNHAKAMMTLVEARVAEETGKFLSTVVPPIMTVNMFFALVEEVQELIIKRCREAIK